MCKVIAVSESKLLNPDWDWKTVKLKKTHGIAFNDLAGPLYFQMSENSVISSTRIYAQFVLS